MVNTKKKKFIRNKPNNLTKKNTTLNTYGNTFQPQDLMKKTKYNINLNKNDNIYQFTGNVLSLYNIDYNPNFVKGKLDKFRNDIKDYLSIIKNNKSYLNSVTQVKQKSDILELKSIFNEYELHLLLESMDLLFNVSKSSNFKNTQSLKTKNINMKGGGPFDSYDIIAYLNGDKRKKVKKKILDLLIGYENTKLIKNNVKDHKLNKFLQDIMRGSYTALPNSIIERKPSKPTTPDTQRKKPMEEDIYMEVEPTTPDTQRKKPMEVEPPQQNNNILNIIWKPWKEDATNKKRKKFESLVEEFDKLQIPKNEFAKKKEEKLKSYFANLSFIIGILGMIPPEFFGEDMDYNPFDILSVIMCIFEGNTFCAIMSALPLFSPMLDMLSTFSSFRKILNKFGYTGIVGKRSKAAFTKAEIAKNKKMVKQKDRINELELQMTEIKLKIEKDPTNVAKVKEYTSELKDKGAEWGEIMKDHTDTMRINIDKENRILSDNLESNYKKALEGDPSAEINAYQELLKRKNKKPNVFNDSDLEKLTTLEKNIDPHRKSLIEENMKEQWKDLEKLESLKHSIIDITENGPNNDLLDMFGKNAKELQEANILKQLEEATDVKTQQQIMESLSPSFKKEYPDIDNGLRSQKLKVDDKSTPVLFKIDKTKLNKKMPDSPSTEFLLGNIDESNKVLEQAKKGVFIEYNRIQDLIESNPDIYQPNGPSIRDLMLEVEKIKNTRRRMRGTIKGRRYAIKRKMKVGETPKLKMRNATKRKRNATKRKRNATKRKRNATKIGFEVKKKSKLTRRNAIKRKPNLKNEILSSYYDKKKTELENLRRLKSNIAMKDPQEELQFVLDNLASSYLLKNKAQESWKKMQEDPKPLNMVSFANNMLGHKVMETFEKLLNNGANGSIDVNMNALKKTLKASKVLSALNPKDAEETLRRRDRLSVGKTLINIQKRNKNSLFKEVNYINKGLGFTLTRKNKNELKTQKNNNQKKIDAQHKLKIHRDGDLRGGGKKNNVMRNEIINEDILIQEVEKFSLKFKKKMGKINKPLKELLNKRSEYRIKLKLNFKEEYIINYRNMKRTLLNDNSSDKKIGDNQNLNQLYFDKILFKKLNNNFKNKKNDLFEKFSFIFQRLFITFLFKFDIYSNIKNHIQEFEKIEQNTQELLKNPDTKKFKDTFDKKNQEIVIQEDIIKKTKRKVQEFKATDDKYNLEEEKLKELIKQINGINPKNDNEKKYYNFRIKKNKIQKQIFELKIQIDNHDKTLKKDAQPKNLLKLKKVFFDEFKKTIRDEIDFIKNEFDIANLLSLNISKIKKLNLINFLREIYLDIFKLKKSLEVINNHYKIKNIKLNEEIESGKKQLKFFYTSMSKIKLKKEQILFMKRFKNREYNLKLLTKIQSNMIDEYIDNMNNIDKCNDLLIFCDYQINTLKNVIIIKETKHKLLTDTEGLIDLTELQTQDLILELKTNEKELIDILDDILKYKKKINRTRKSLYKKLTSKQIKEKNLKDKIKKSKKKEDKNKLNIQLQIIGKRIDDYKSTNIDYLTFESPLEILFFYDILDQNLKDGKYIYNFNKETLNSIGIELSLKLKKKIKEINSFILSDMII